MSSTYRIIVSVPSNGDMEANRTTIRRKKAMVSYQRKEWNKLSEDVQEAVVRYNQRVAHDKPEIL